MTFLPIVDRELRVAARHWFTYWGRVGAAGLALVVFTAMQILFLASAGAFPNMGRIQFGVMKWLCFIVASLAGIFLTSDTLSEEKRDGTLGLLFLTDLKGFDVVLGKLISHSTQAFYGLLAAFPLLGLSLLIGGVGGGEFGRTALVICNTLFLSLCAGILISSLSRDAIKAMNGAFLALVLLMGGVLVADFAIARSVHRNYDPILSLASPSYLFYHTSSYLSHDWWLCLGIQHAVAWVFLVAACLITPRAWRDKAAGAATSSQSLRYRWRFGGAAGRARFRRALFQKNPLAWLGLRDRWVTRMVWLGMCASVGCFVCQLLYIDNTQPYLGMKQLSGTFQFLFRAVFVLWVASQACRFFVEGVRNGALELILVTPVTPEQIVKGQTRALIRTFLLPALLLLGMNLTDEIKPIIQSWNARPVGTPAFNGVDYEIVSLISRNVTYFGNLLAIASFGMWMGLTTGKTSVAVLKTVCFVTAFPWLAIMFAQGIFMITLARLQLPFWLGAVGAIILNVIKDVVFILWSRRMLRTKFRVAVTQEPRYTLLQNPPPLPATPPPPLPA